MSTPNLAIPDLVVAERPPLTEVIIRHVPRCPFKIKRGTKHVCQLCGEQRFMPVHHSPSLNQFGKNRSGFVYNTAKQAWHEEWIQLLEAAGLPKGLKKVYVEGRMSFGDNVERDQGNHRYFIEKSLGDALQRGGWIKKDVWGRFEFGQLDRTDEPKTRWTELMIFPSY